MGATLCQLFWEMVWIFTVVTFINKSYVRNRISEHFTTENALIQLCLVLNEGIKFFYDYLIVWPFIFFYYSFSYYTVFEYESLRTRTYFRSLLLKKPLRVVASQLLLLRSTSQETLLQSWNSRCRAYLVTLTKIQDTPASEVARIHSSCILSFDLIGWHQNERLNVTEIILPFGFADFTFLVERSDDRKNVCVRRLIWILPFQKRHLYNYFTDNRIVIFKVVRTLHYMV